MINIQWKRRVLALFFALHGLALGEFAQSTYFVDANAAAGGSGGIADPFDRLQDAMDVALTGDTLLVLPGRYGQLNFIGKDVEVKSLEGSDSTSIAGVVFNSGETRAALLAGFSLKLGFFGFGSVICSGSSPTIRDNEISGNSVPVAGTGFSIVGGSSPLIEANRIVGNVSTPGVGYAGAAYVSSSSPVFKNNVFLNNGAFADYGTSFGGALYIDKSTVLLEGNLFQGNSCSDEALNRGGAIYAQGSTLTLRGNTFVGNRAYDPQPGPFGGPGEGGALYLRNCVTRGSNNSIWGNRASVGREIATVGGVFNASFSNIDSSPGAISGTATIDLGASVINVDPLLDASFHLTSASPLIDAGQPGLPPGGLDHDLDPRLLDGLGDGVVRMDIGWDEFNIAGLAVTGSGALGTDFNIQSSGAAGQNYFLLAALGTGDFAFKNFGSILISLPDLMIIGFGGVPGSDVFTIPNNIGLVGQTAHFQSLVRTPSVPIGSLSRRVDITLHQ